MRIIRGFFLAIEGIDGAGKTTLANNLAAFFVTAGIDIVKCQRSYFPLIKQLLDQLRDKSEPAPRSIALAYALDYFMQMELIIIPAIAENKMVLSDRYIFSSHAYNAAFGLNLDWSIELYQGSVLPDLTIFLEIAPEMAQSRIKDDDPFARGINQDNLIFQRKVRSMYQLLDEKYHFLNLDATLSTQQITEIVVEHLIRERILE